MKLKKMLVLLFSMVLMLVVVACSNDEGGSTDKKEGGADKTEEKATPKISIMTKLHTAEVPDDKLKKLFEEKANVELTIEWVPDNNYSDKLSTAFATGTFPQAVTMGADQIDMFKEAIRDDQFWEIGPYFDEFENLAKLNETVVKNTMVDGKVYSLYQGRPFSRQGLIYRKDWAEKLGLEAPKTVDEFYEMARAFTEDDPDGNGKDDTIGLTDRSDLVFGVFKTIASWHGTPNNWGEKDGELLPEFMFPEYKESMNYVKKLRDNKFMNQDFPVTSKEDQQAMLKNGTAGMYVGAMVDVLGLYNDAVELNPDLVFDVHNYVAGPSGEFTVWSNPGYNNEIVFPKSAIKTEEELKDVLAFFDLMMTPEFSNLAQWGVEGEHYTVENGFAVVGDDQDTFEREVFSYNMLGIGEPASNGRYESKHSYEPRQKVEELILENDNHLIHDPTITLDSDTYVKDGARLQEIINDATYNYMLGEIDEAGFDGEVEKWKSQGGSKIIEEFNASR
ncbi:extracellular solute-binding protein [Sporosarcina sp. Marseille-Q4063]|uniref:extracellular solute-binding protein n=1 Tax=Sporosarcina sp. Marseille-Q4063 TaxID=2810514 RepID=UPI001BB0B8EE|nr:extracellular solute-binding protein [Sporosarcina sp. Marseille-Q4063]QUW21567.1 extracellular solute-binding protein [Sporosarcina sp. Marseille-Q4063]